MKHLLLLRLFLEALVQFTCVDLCGSPDSCRAIYGVSMCQRRAQSGQSKGPHLPIASRQWAKKPWVRDIIDNGRMKFGENPLDESW